ncbi:MAG: hypothetical protein NZ959_07980 [Armatimonadetes bacterium]|nr:hypothetical protein [Armatimonadota bacterium]
MRAWLSAILLLLLFVYIGYFVWINNVAGFYDPASKMVIIHFWRGITVFSSLGFDQWRDMGIALRPAELILFSAAIACFIGFVWGWSAARKRVGEQSRALAETKKQLEAERQKVSSLEQQLIQVYQLHENRLADLADKILAVTKAALPSGEVHIETLPLPSGTSPPGEGTGPEKATPAS